MPLSWPELHGALTHFPVALLISACIFEIGAMVMKRPTGRIVSFWMLVGAVVMAVPALITGWMTGSELFGASPRPPSVFVQHRLTAFLTFGLAVLLLVWRTKARDQFASRTLMASVFLTLIIAGMVGYVGFLGGRMVFGGTHYSVDEHAKQGESAPVAGAESKNPKVSPALLALGRKLFQSNNCVSCHTVNGIVAQFVKTPSRLFLS